MTRARSFSITTVLALGSTTCCLLALTACSLIGVTYSQRQGVARTVTPSPERIEQLDFGQRAHFARCVEPACPAVTRKTVALTEQRMSPTAATLPIPAEPPFSPPHAPVRRVEPEPVVASAAAAAAASRIDKVVLHFATDSAALTPTHTSLLRNSLDELRTADRIVIFGRTDNLGSQKVNQELALARALAIRDHLLSLVPDLPARISIDAKGRCCYAAPNQTPDGRAQNRRVELVFTVLGEVRS